MCTSSTITKVGLRNKETNELVKYRTARNKGDFCVDTQHILTSTGDREWLVNNPYHAEWVRRTDTGWYNADYDTPSHDDDFDPDDYEVVMVTITTDVRPTKVPYDPEKIVDWCFRKEPKMRAYVKGKHKDLNELVDLYRLNEWLRAKKLGG